MTKDIDRKVEIVDRKGEVIGKGIVKDKKGDGQVVKLTKQITRYKGPIPPAKELERYNKLYPKAAEIILKDFERISQYRLGHNKTVLDAQIKLDKIAQWQGFLVSILMILGAILCAFLKQNGIGVALVGVSALGIVKALLPRKGK